MTTAQRPTFVIDADLRERIAALAALNDSEMLTMIDGLVAFAADWQQESAQGQADARAMQDALRTFGLLPLRGAAR